MTIMSQMTGGHLGHELQPDWNSFYVKDGCEIFPQILKRASERRCLFISTIFRELFYVGWFKLISNKLFGLHQKFMQSYMVTNWACSVSLALKVFLTMTDFALVGSWPLLKRFTGDWKSGQTSRVTGPHSRIEVHRARFWSSKISSIFQVWSVFRNVFWEFLISDVSKWLISKSWKKKSGHSKSADS